VIGRLTVVAEFLHQNIGLRGKSVAEIGAGEGVFLNIIRKDPYGAEVYAIEPSSANARFLRDLNVPTFEGTIGPYMASPEAARKFDVVAMLWTLECCRSPRQMLEAAYEMLKPGGSVVVGTGSRILVPFKKPLHMFFSKSPVDTHPVHFSANTLRGLLTSTGFDVSHVNRYIDNDLLIMMGRKQDNVDRHSWPRDDWKAVIAFFDRWHKETQDHYAHG
jgi:2-polyprenyl-3-methyl-5-hydroxy-6-metoxy-1,4-benzoquinol methylase